LYLFTGIIATFGIVTGCTDEEREAGAN
jgi:hypothetical protein